MIAAVAPLSRFFQPKTNSSTSAAGGGFSRRRCSLPSFPVRQTVSCLSSHGDRPRRYAVLGAGFAGLSVAWHLLRQSPMDLDVHIDMYDDAGIGGGASGVAGGLVHPYSPKVKLLWRGVEFWTEWLSLLNIAQEAAKSRTTNDSQSFSTCVQKTVAPVIRKRGIMRPATNEKNLVVMLENAQKCLTSCRIEIIDRTAAQHLLPEVCAPLNLAFFMPEAMNINPQFYLEALFLACQNLVADIESKSLLLYKENVAALSHLAGEYDAVIICLGARVDMLPELAGRLPLRTCRGIVATLQLPDGIGEEYPAHSPAILSGAWLAVEGPRSLHLGATWNWESRNPSQDVSQEEATRSLEELLPKATAVYPEIRKWTPVGARAGLRAMPPLTVHGSLPLLGCLDEFVASKCNTKYWLVSGLGSRGILYHGWLGKLTAQAVLSCNEDSIPPELISWKKGMCSWYD
ncbi:hypothetical protein Droror1_Dr00011685 [Drosera rotundifolia]